MKCWNDGCNVDIVRGENWTPQSKVWLETATDRPHNFKQCFKRSSKFIPPKKKYEKTGDPIVDDANRNYYPDLYYFLKFGYPTNEYDQWWLPIQ